MPSFLPAPATGWFQPAASPLHTVTEAAAPVVPAAAAIQPVHANIPAFLGGYSLFAGAGGSAAGATTAHAQAAAPSTAQADAAAAEVRVNADDAKNEHRGATTKVLQTAKGIQATATQVDADVASGKAQKNKDGDVVETTSGPKGCRTTTVHHNDDGSVTVTVQEGATETMQTVTVDKDGKTKVEETTFDWSRTNDKDKPDVVTRTSTVDGSTTKVDTTTAIFGQGSAETVDTYRTQTGSDGMHDNVKEGFAGDQSTEVHEQETTISDTAGVTSQNKTTSFSQGNHRVTRNENELDGGTSTSWTQEVQNGNEYHSQTRYEGQPNVLYQVYRKADPTTGTVTENTAISDPVAGTVSMASESTRMYDAEGRLATSNTTEKDGTTTRTTSYTAQYTDNADGTTSVREETDATVAEEGKPVRKTVQTTDAVDTKEGRRVDHVRTEVAFDGVTDLVADSDGAHTTVDGKDDNGNPIHLDLDATGMAANDETKAVLDGSGKARSMAYAGLEATSSGARASAIGTPLLGAFADNRQAVDTSIEIWGVNLDDGYLGKIAGGADAADAQAMVAGNDVARLVHEGKGMATAAMDGLKVKKVVQAAGTGFDDVELAAMDKAAAATTMGKVGRIGSEIGAAWSLYTGIQDYRKALDTDDPLDHRDLMASAIGNISNAAIGAAALLGFGPPGWAVAVIGLLIQDVVSGIHDIDDDKRRGHPEEAAMEKKLTLLGPLLHLYYKHKDSSEIREHDLESDVPGLDDVDADA